MSCEHLPKSESTDKAFDVRREVFHREQGVPEERDFDGLDETSDQFVVYKDDIAVGTARVRYINGVAKIERMAILKSYRGQALGEELMMYILDFLKNKQIEQVCLESQVQASGFYEKLGFVGQGDTFDDVGIPHIKMVADLRK